MAEALLPVREEHELLVVPEALAVEHRRQMAPRLRVVALDEAEALGWPVCRHRLAHDRDEVGLLALPVPQLGAVDADDDRLQGRGQAGALRWTGGERKDGLRAEFRLETAGDWQRVPTHCHAVQGRIDG